MRTSSACACVCVWLRPSPLCVCSGGEGRQLHRQAPEITATCSAMPPPTTKREKFSSPRDDVIIALSSVQLRRSQHGRRSTRTIAANYWRDTSNPHLPPPPRHVCDETMISFYAKIYAMSLRFRCRIIRDGGPILY